MYKNYENRVKNFIIEMNDPETKIEIKNYEERINNPKTDLLKEKEIQKPFIFKGYTTEEDRIKDSIKRNRYLFNLPDYDDELNNKTENIEGNKVNSLKNNEFNKNIKKIKIQRNNTISKNKENKYKYILKNDLIIQPEMRFKPRTDLERVYDMVNGYKYGLARKDVLDKQLKNLDLNKYKNSNELRKKIILKNKTESSSSESDNDSYSKIKIENKEKKNKLYFNPNSEDYKMKPWMKRTDLNTDAYKLLNSYHYKTHFKAAKEVAENKIKIEKYDKNKKLKKNRHCLLLPNLFQNKKLYNSDILNSTYNNDKDIKLKNYDKNKNPFKKEKIFEENKLKLISNIAFNKNKNKEIKEKEYNFYFDENRLFDKNINEDNIMIDNERFDKNKQFDLITNKILDKCNIFNHKSKFNNTTLKKRNGKLMFTRGLSVEQFEQKYGFN